MSLGNWEGKIQHGSLSQKTCLLHLITQRLRTMALCKNSLSIPVDSPVSCSFYGLPGNPQVFLFLLNKNKKQEEKNKSKTDTHACSYQHPGTYIWNCTECQCHAHHGRLSSGRLLHCLGCPLHSFSCSRISFHPQNIK